MHRSIKNMHPDMAARMSTEVVKTIIDPDERAKIKAHVEARTGRVWSEFDMDAVLFDLALQTFERSIETPGGKKPRKPPERKMRRGIGSY